MFFEIKELNVYYGLIKALENINLTLNEGEIVSLIGANGAGKSTLLKAITGLVKPDKGNIFFENNDLTKTKPEKIVKLGISMVPEGRRVFPDLTVKENLELGAYCISDKKLENQIYEQVLITFPRLKERLKQSAGTLSGGEQQMLAIGRALMSNPKILLLDEPSMGLSPKITKEIFMLIRDINKSKGISIILVEQNAHMAMEISKKVFVIENGSIKIEGTPKELKGNPLVLKAYLGG